MCTAAVYHTKNHYFGRNLDQAQSFPLSVAVIPRNYPLKLRNLPTIEKHLAIVGTAYMNEGYPLLYDAINERGVGMAGLLFPDNASFQDLKEGMDNICEFEFMPWILSQSSSMEDVRNLLSRANLTKQPYSESLPISPMHWIVSDGETAVVVEPMKEGLCVYDNPLMVLTNNPPFPYHMENINNYMNLTSAIPTNRFSDKLDLKEFSFGFGGIGLPGDISSGSRFVRACFTLFNSVVEDDSEGASVSQFFHILQNECQVHGLATVEDGYETTIYSSCGNLEQGVYYYTTYENSHVNAVDMHREDLDGSEVKAYPQISKLEVNFQN